MTSPLAYDEAIVKEFKVGAEAELEPEAKLGYVRTQYDEIKKFLYRERVELILAETQAKSDVEALAAKARSDIASHRSNIKGVVASLSVLGELVKELEQEVA